jgi:hypothetical protein
MPRFQAFSRWLLPLALLGGCFSTPAAFAAPAQQLKMTERAPEATATTKVNAQTFLLTAESFEGNGGSWSGTGYFGALTGAILTGRTDSDKAATIPARATVNITTPGKYHVWARVVDFTKTGPGSRYFNIRLGSSYDKAFGNTGKHDSWAWESGGTVDLPIGPLKIELVDTSAHYARFDGLYLSLKATPPPASGATLLDQVTPQAPVINFSATAFPAWARVSAPPSQELVLQNPHLRLHFAQVAAGGKTVIQQWTELAHAQDWIAVSRPTDPFGYIVAFTDACQISGDYTFNSDNYKASVKTTTGTRTITTASIYDLGLTQWLIPTAMKQIDDQTVELQATTDLAELTVTFSLPPTATEPKVTCTLKAKRAGNFTLGMFNGPERKIDGIDYVLCGKPYLGRFVPSNGCLVREQASPNQTVLMSVPLDAAQNLGAAATFAIVVDPDSVGYRWAKADTSKYGLALRSPQGALQPGLFAPLPASKEAKLTPGQTFSFGYYPIARLEGWFETYRHIADGILNVRDEKRNYHASLTDTIFNVQDLMMADQKFSGWHDKAMAFAYAESINGISGGFNHSSPLTMVQQYLLTEDPKWYAQRTIPTMAYLLSRSGQWTQLKDHPNDAKMGELTGPRKSYPSSIYTALYQLSRGQSPRYRQIGMLDDYSYWSVGAFKGQAAKLIFLEQAHRYRFTRDPKLLAQARQGADEYIEKYVNPAPEHLISGIGFELMTTAPWTEAMLTMYEITGDQKYLDAAHECARRLLAHGTWIQPRVPEGDVTIKIKDLLDRGLMHDPNRAGTSVHGWNHTDRIILGYKINGNINAIGHETERIPSVFAELKDETVPAWLVSRVGLNMEHGSQLGSKSDFDSPNIMMNCFAPDFLRIATYTGDKLFATIARNEVIAQAANYPGYYVNNMMTMHQKADFPYKGPDETAIEYTHIPPYLAKLQDYLFTQAWAWSGQKIAFPWLRQYAYAYFDNKIYGSAPGKFFDVDGVWPWLKRGLLTVDSMQIDWLAARKDGQFVAALMNEDLQPTKVTVTLGKDITGGAALNGEATLYAADGSSSKAPVADGKLTLTVPPHSLVGVALAAPAVKAPAYAAVDPTAMAQLNAAPAMVLPDASNISTAYALQIDPHSYFAYTFLPQTELKTATLHYRLGEGAAQSKSIADYPYETIVEVKDPTQPFTYHWEYTDTKGAAKQTPEKTIRALSAAK